MGRPTSPWSWSRDRRSARCCTRVRCPAEQVVHYGRQLADALTHAHERGVIHRDLKSNNVIVTPDRRVKVLDFGLAKRAVDSDMTAAVTEIHASLTQAGTAVGTLPYMSPEQLRGEQRATSRATSGRSASCSTKWPRASRPFKGNTPFELSAAILSDEPVQVPDHIRPELKHRDHRLPREGFAATLCERAGCARRARRRTDRGHCGSTAGRTRAAGIRSGHARHRSP